MEFNNNIPIYLQVINKIKLDIIKGKLKPGDKMPSLRDYSNELGINLNTVARVYKEMEKEDIVFTKRGLGTFITESENIIKCLRFEMAQELIDNFIQGMEKVGFTREEMINLIKNQNDAGERNEKNE